MLHSGPVSVAYGGAQEAVVPTNHAEQRRDLEHELRYTRRVLPTVRDLQLSQIMRLCDADYRLAWDAPEERGEYRPVAKRPAEE